MATMHFYIAQTDLFMGNLKPFQYCPWGARWVKLNPGIVGLRVMSVIIMFVYVFTLFIRLSLIFLNMQMKLLRTRVVQVNRGLLS